MKKLNWYNIIIFIMVLLTANFIIVLGTAVGIPKLLELKYSNFELLIFTLGIMSSGILIILIALSELTIFKEAT